MNTSRTSTLAMAGREMPVCTSVMAVNGIKRGAAGVFCVPLSIRCEAVAVMPDAVDGGADGDPKGAGVLTTRTRYSRKRHRQTPYFCHRVLTTSVYNSHFCVSSSSNRRQTAVNTADSMISGGESVIMCAPGAITTHFSNIDL